MLFLCMPCAAAHAKLSTIFLCLSLGVHTCKILVDAHSPILSMRTLTETCTTSRKKTPASNIVFFYSDESSAYLQYEHSPIWFLWLPDTRKSRLLQGHCPSARGATYKPDFTRLPRHQSDGDASRRTVRCTRYCCRVSATS